MLVAVLTKQCLTRNIVFNNSQIVPTIKAVANPYLLHSLRSVYSLPVRNSSLLLGRVWPKISLRKTLLQNFSKRNASDIKTNVKNNVFLYSYETSAFRIARYFAFSQMIAWIWMSYFVYHPELLSIFKGNVNVREYFQKCGGHLLLFLWPMISGCFILTVVMLYLSRTVKYIILHKDGQLISVVTYGLLKPEYIITKRVNEVCTVVGRSDTKGVIPMKLKGNRFYYLLSSGGNFVNKSLYDNTIGYRKTW